MSLINMTSKDGITLKTAGKYCAEDIIVVPTFVGDVEYVIGTPVEFVLTAGNWNGTIYKLEDISEYGEVGELQIGIPPSSSMINARLLEQCALTIAQISNSYTKEDLDGDGTKETLVYKDTTIVISAVTAPTQDVTIALWGLENE